MDYKTTKTENDSPSAGHALVIRVTPRYARTTNGAWISAPTPPPAVFEIPLDYLNSREGVGWLNSSGSTRVVLPDESQLFLSTDNLPIRTHGFGDFGYVVFPGPPGAKQGISFPHPLLPNLAPAYYRVEFFSPEVLATFKRHDFEADRAEVAPAPFTLEGELKVGL